jgi:hypothetical protein
MVAGSPPADSGGEVDSSANWHSPDGLTEDEINTLFGVSLDASGPRPTTALFDGTARERRERREARRLLRSTMTALHMRRPVSTPAGTEAA